MNLSLDPNGTTHDVGNHTDHLDLGSSYVSPIYKAADSVDGSSLARKKKGGWAHELQAASFKP